MFQRIGPGFGATLAVDAYRVGTDMGAYADTVG